MRATWQRFVDWLGFTPAWVSFVASRTAPFALALLAGSALGQEKLNTLPCKVGATCAGSTAVITTGTLASGQVALGSGPTSITGDTGLTYDASTDTLTVAGACVVPTLSPSGDVVSQKRGTNSQTFRLYHTDDGAGNADWVSISGRGPVGPYSGSAVIGTVASGTGTASQLALYSNVLYIDGGAGGTYFLADGVTKARLTGASFRPFGSDNTMDLGDGTYRFRTGYFGTSVSAPLVQSTGTVRLAGYTVATLPAGTVGDTAYVTDATAPTYLGALTGGGAVTTPVFYNGAAWVSH